MKYLVLTITFFERGRQICSPQFCCDLLSLPGMRHDSSVGVGLAHTPEMMVVYMSRN